MSTSSTLVLVRHPAVAADYRGLCYGRSDVPLGDEGLRRAEELAEELSRLPIRHVVSSDLSRCRIAAERIAARSGVPLTIEPALRERDYGAWELRPWDALFAEVGEAIHDLIRHPSTARPDGGETTDELRDRVLVWYAARPCDGLVVAVTHGGPIGALRGTLAGLPPTGWYDLVPPVGTWVWAPEGQR